MKKQANTSGHAEAGQTHSESILRELDYSDEEIQKLGDEKVI